MRASIEYFSRRTARLHVAALRLSARCVSRFLQLDLKLYINKIVTVQEQSVNGFQTHLIVCENNLRIDSPKTVLLYSDAASSTFQVRLTNKITGIGLNRTLGFWLWLAATYAGFNAVLLLPLGTLESTSVPTSVTNFGSNERDNNSGSSSRGFDSVITMEVVTRSCNLQNALMWNSIENTEQEWKEYFWDLHGFIDISLRDRALLSTACCFISIHLYLYKFYSTCI